MTTGDRALEASKRLDELLRKPIEGDMPELGGKKFAGEFSGILGSLRENVKKSLAAAQEEIAAAASELVTTIDAGKRQIVRAIKQETDAVNRAYSEMTGNGAPEEPETPETPITDPGDTRTHG